MKGGQEKGETHGEKLTEIKEEERQIEALPGEMANSLILACPASTCGGRERRENRGE